MRRLPLSFGYVVQDSEVRADGVKELRKIDLFEVTPTPKPANADTRVLAYKSAERDDTAGLPWPLFPPDDVLWARGAEITAQGGQAAGAARRGPRAGREVGA